MQLHLQVSPQDFAANWNAAQTLLGPQLAVGANSPYLFGKHLWAETRTELFLQATDTRSIELKNQGVRPRVFFGERWITSIFDLFEENVRYFPALLPEVSDEDPVAVLDRGEAPRLQELRLHNGTVYRWNRPIYDIVDGRPHLRVENRVLPAGPTVVDVLANSAFYYGAMRMLSEQDRPVWTGCSFATAEANFTECAPPAAWRHRSTGRASARCRPRSSCCATCCRWPTRAGGLGCRRSRCATATWGSSRRAARAGATARLAGPDGPAARGARPTGSTRCARCCGVLRGHARQRARAHLAAAGVGPSADWVVRSCATT